MDIKMSLVRTPKKTVVEKKEVLERYAVIAIDSMDRVTIVTPLYAVRHRMTTEYKKRKAAGESHLIKAKLEVVVTKIYEGK